MIKPLSPTLLPPSTPCISVLGTGSDVGKSIVATARDYHERKKSFQQMVNDALDRLKIDFDLIVMEGTGFPAKNGTTQTSLV